MHVDHPVGEPGQEGAGEQPHVARQDDELDAAVEQPRGHRLVVGRPVGKGIVREDLDLDTRRARALERRRRGLVAGHRHELDSVVAVDGVEDGLQVGAGAGGQDGEPQPTPHPGLHSPSGLV